MSEDMLKLAERCEAATADQQREMIEDAFAACFQKPQRIWVTDNDGAWTDEYTAYHELSWRFHEMIEAGAYLDAAMTLVPEGWFWMAGRRDDNRCRAYVNNGESPFVGFAARPNPAKRWFECLADTPALALCAAALRARASQGKD